MSETKNRNYRATFILDTRGVEAPVEELVDTYGKLIEEVSGKLESTDNLGNHDFARNSRSGLPNGIFVQYKFSAPAEAPAEIHSKVRLDRKVNRVMVEQV